MEKEPSFKVTQMIPVTDVWYRDKNEDGSFYYHKALALIYYEMEIEKTAQIFHGIKYIFRYDIEYLDLNENQLGCDIFFTHELEGIDLSLSYNRPDENK